MESPFINDPVGNREEVAELLHKADFTTLNGRRSAIVIGFAHVRVLQAGLGLSMADIERIYREFESRTYLLAIPSASLPPNLKAVFLPSHEPAEFYVWIGVNGAAEAQEHLRYFGVEDEQKNLGNLGKAGILEMVEQPSF